MKIKDKIKIITQKVLPKKFLSNVIAGASVVDASAPTVALSLAFGFFDESVEHALRSIAKNKICKNFMR